ncbi:hypothetical protein OG394_15660 [Kribbella sp. NBC_01245]|uniref:hypothetical protein n=1 Tax=Kribbella sp. NBC_01245 TaxID=2903578 RepID=UPI002E2C7355|nr:hypothetical protein [Kribbella sp. NBC_01245]
MVYEDQGVVAGGNYSFPDQGTDPAGAGDHPATRVVEVSVDDASVEWQVVSRNAANDPQAWRPATGLKDWSFLLNTTDHGSGPKTIVVRLTEHGAKTARVTVRATFR